MQDGHNVKGRFYFITNNGRRIDCSEKDDGYNIHGSIENGVANVQYESTFSGKGYATMSAVNNCLIFDILDDMPFVQANMSAPKEIQLKKKS